MKKKNLLLIISLLTIIVLVNACSSNSSKDKGQDGGAAPTGGSLKFGLAAEPDTMDPLVQNGTHGRTIKLAIYRGLFNYNKDGELQPELAEDYSVSEDGTTYTFNLRDAKFHNGDTVTADDVKYTFERILEPGSKATFAAELSVIDTVEVVDEKTVEFNLTEPSAPLLHYLAIPESVIVSKSWIEENGENADPMGAGPFKFVDWKKGQEFTVEKFDEFYIPDKPKVDEIKFVFYTDENTRGNALRAGDVDLIETVPWKDVESMENDPNLKLDSVNGPFMKLQFNTKFEPFNDPKVRQAISYAIDRNTIINTAFSGRGEGIYGIAIPEGYMGYKEEYANYFEHNIEKAKELLAEAGYPDGFKARLLATSQYTFHEQTAVAVKSELEKIGIEVELDLPDWATRINKNTEGDYDFIVAGTSGDITDADWLSNFYTGGEVRLNNSAYFKDEKIDELLMKGRSEIDDEKREEIYDELIERALELSPFVYLTWREQSYGMSKDVEGFKNLPGFLSFQSGITLDEVTIEK
ncbi:ABC transporter substrate-binding protein [Pseudogracilibacillus sp. SE30717A]|uniref:ABC transporter substrate-binding protein n=1 Tax=Pseudogracilibacillus sp. SE30717A TaxID=3098293 RepID=UPI00300DE6E3